jgi:predicted  nucleic acid-binding Zn-ribbon protein
LGSHVPLVQLGDLDLLLAEIGDPEARTRLKKLGFSLEGVAHLERARAKLAAAIDRRWMLHYDRAHRRYGRAVVGVRDRVCMGCFVTLPTSAQPRLGEGEGLGVCESCGRILYWG